MLLFYRHQSQSDRLNVISTNTKQAERRRFLTRGYAVDVPVIVMSSFTNGPMTDRRGSMTRQDASDRDNADDSSNYEKTAHKGLIYYVD